MKTLCVIVCLVLTPAAASTQELCDVGGDIWSCSPGYLQYLEASGQGTAAPAGSVATGSGGSAPVATTPPAPSNPLPCDDVRGEGCVPETNTSLSGSAGSTAPAGANTTTAGTQGVNSSSDSSSSPGDSAAGGGNGGAE